MRQNKYYQLFQFMQYHVIVSTSHHHLWAPQRAPATALVVSCCQDDSKPTACLLLSLEKKYPPAFQMALDMFKRLGGSHDEIATALLTSGHVMAALRFIQSMAGFPIAAFSLPQAGAQPYPCRRPLVGQGAEAVAAIPARQYLEAAHISNDSMLFYNGAPLLSSPSSSRRLPADGGVCPQSTVTLFTATLPFATRPNFWKVPARCLPAANPSTPFFFAPLPTPQLSCAQRKNANST